METDRSKSKPARPYVGDAVRASAAEDDRPNKPVVAIGFVLLALVVGFVIGLAVYAVMNLSTWLTERLWGFSGTFALFPLETCAVGSVIIVLWTYWSRDEVQPLEVVMHEFKETGSYRTNGALRPVVSFLLPLVFGGSIGFEAGLTGLITSGCCWIRDQLKRRSAPDRHDQRHHSGVSVSHLQNAVRGHRRRYRGRS